MQSALDDVDHAIELTPTNERAFYTRGLIYYGLGRFEEAIVDFIKTSELNPNFADAYNNLCWTGSLTGKAAKVIDACDRAVELAPEKFTYYDSRGVARALTGDITTQC